MLSVRVYCICRHYSSLTLVIVEGLWSVSLVVVSPGVERTVNGDLLVVGSQTVTVGVRVGEQTTLSHTQHRGVIIMYNRLHHTVQYVT